MEFCIEIFMNVPCVHTFCACCFMSAAEVMATIRSSETVPNNLM